MQPITEWLRLSHLTNDFEMNHIENDHNALDKPLLPQFAGTTAAVWRGYHMWLSDHRPTPKVVGYGPDDL